MESGVAKACWPILFFASALAACSKSPSPPQAPIASAEIASPARDISLRPEQLRFDYTGIAVTLRFERRPASRLTARPDPNTQATPAHLLAIFDPATLPDPAWPESRALIVYPAADWSKTYIRLGRRGQDPVPALTKLLDDEPQMLGIEFPPVAGHTGARQILRSGVKYLEFHGGRGVRFLTVYQGDPLPVANRDVAYVFHGLTNDGRYWVTLNFPLNARLLPAPDVALAELADYDHFIAGHAKYIVELAHKLDDAGAWTPCLNRSPSTERFSARPAPEPGRR
jgi:hypothetical protein